MNTEQQIDLLTMALAGINVLIENDPTNEELLNKRKKYEQDLNTINTGMRNNAMVAEMAREEMVTQHNRRTEYREYITSDLKTSLITAPTQVGKSNAIFEFMKVSLELNIPIIVSCDNKINQLDQIFRRMTLVFEYDLDVVLCKVTPKLNKQLIDNAKTGKKTVIVCLDNASQIEKIKNSIVLADNEGYHFDDVVLIHDEGDVITKNHNIETVDDSQSKSHQQWLKLVEYLENKQNNPVLQRIHPTNLKRVFVSATPENVVYKYNVEKVFSLIIPNNYIGYDRITYNPLGSNEEIMRIIVEEQNRRIINNDSGIILYCTERKISEGQDITFEAICDEVSCSVSTYNGCGITARITRHTAFEKELKNFIRLSKRGRFEKITYKKNNQNIFNIKGLAISEFYKLCKDSGNTIVITIGMDLMARGISFVSSKDNKDDTLAATTMIYRPGQQMHAVGLAQAIGRITGIARSDLERTLYAPQDVIDTYIKFNQNQRQYLTELKRNNGIVSKEIMEQIEFNKKLSRPLDRKNLRLRPRYKPEETTEPTRNTDETIDGVTVSRLQEWLNSDVIVGKILRILYQQTTEISVEELKDQINYDGALNSFTSTLRNGCGINAQYGKLRSYRNNQVKLNEIIKRYIDTLN